MKKELFMRFTICINILMLFGTFLMIFPTESSASNFKSTFLFDYSQDTQNDQTDFRSKEDSSDVYMKCTDTGRSYVAIVVGGNYFFDYVDCSEGCQYYFKSGESRYMHSNVYENYFYAKVYSTSTDPTSKAMGVWSPDSVYEEDVLPSSDYLK